MKILKLDLIAYGPFTGKELDFRNGSANLHLIHGPNEAGKSCTLRALSDALYGIPQDTLDAFLHPYDDLRIGLTVETAQGVLDVVRRKGRTNSLRRADASESVFPAAEWAALLPVEDRARFRMAFGVDHAEIAKGGKELLAAGNDLGGLLFAASGEGLERLRAVQSGLQQDAEDLFTKRASKPRINKAVADLKAALKEMKDAQTVVGEYRHLRDAAEEAEERSRKLERAIAEASLEEQKLRRLQQAYPLVAKRRQRLEQRKQYEGSRPLAADFGDRYRGAYDELRRCESGISEQARELESLRGKIEATPVSREILERESEIDVLYQQSGVVRKGAADRVKREQSLESLRAEAAALLDSLGAPTGLDRAGELRVAAPAQQRIFLLATNQKAVDQEAAASFRDLEKAREEARKAEEELAGLAAAVDTGALEEALAALPAGRDPESEHERLAGEAAAAQAELERSVSALPGWTGTAEELAGAPAPLPETVEGFHRRFLEAAAERGRLMGERLRLTADRDRVEEDLRRIEQEQQVPAEQDLEASRESRDGQWRTIRGAWLEAIEVDGPALAASFEDSVQTSDEIADRLRREAARVSEKAERLASRARLAAQWAEIETQSEAASRVEAGLQRDWETCWSAAGVAPRTPQEMQGWLRQRDAILTNRREAQQRRDEAARLEESSRAVRQALLGRLAAVGDAAQDAATPLPSLARHGRRVVEAQRKLRERRAALEAEAARLARLIAEQEERRKEAGRRLSEWKCEWNEATAPLPVRREASPEEVQTVLERVNALSAKLDEMRKLEDRIGKLQKDETEFGSRVARLVEEEGGRTADAFAAITKLNEALQANRANRKLLQELASQAEEKEKLLARLTSRSAACREELAGLAGEAGLAGPEDLPVCIERAAERRRLAGELAELDDSLANSTAGGSIEQLSAELEEFNADELPNRIEQAQQRAEKLRSEKAECDKSLWGARRELARKEDAAPAGRAAEEVENLRSRIENLTGEYVRLRVASRILTNAVERFRTKNQGPLLRTAAGLFRQLTAGSFADLRMDWDERGEALLKGVRSGSGKQVGVEGMSEATRDQLFLALRLAYVANYCDAHGPVPFVADDVLMTFDETRAAAALQALESLAQHTQVLLFTHHRHHLDLAGTALKPGTCRVHHLS